MDLKAFALSFFRTMNHESLRNRKALIMFRFSSYLLVISEELCLSSLCDAEAALSLLQAHNLIELLGKSNSVFKWDSNEVTDYLCNFRVITLLHESANHFLYHHHLSELSSFTSKKECAALLSHVPAPLAMADIYLFCRINFFFLNWRITALQCCVGFCHKTTQISHNYIYIYISVYIYTHIYICSFLSLPFPSHPTPL